MEKGWERTEEGGGGSTKQEERSGGAGPEEKQDFAELQCLRPVCVVHEWGEGCAAPSLAGSLHGSAQSTPCHPRPAGRRETSAPGKSLADKPDVWGMAGEGLCSVSLARPDFVPLGGRLAPRKVGSLQASGTGTGVRGVPPGRRPPAQGRVKPPSPGDWLRALPPRLPGRAWRLCCRRRPPGTRCPAAWGTALLSPAGLGAGGAVSTVSTRPMGCQAPMGPARGRSRVRRAAPLPLQAAWFQGSCGTGLVCAQPRGTSGCQGLG